MFLRIFKHLLPNARSWRLTAEKKLKDFFSGLTGIGSDVKDFYDEIFNDIDPQKTRELDLWEQQWGLYNTGLTESQRRDRLDAAWKSVGGQSPRYIQDTLQENGFDVYIHEWWLPGSEPAPNIKLCVTPRNPLLVLKRTSDSIIYLIECGEALAECGEALAECGETLEPPGYPLVNKIVTTKPDITILCGELLAEAGEADALCGNYTDFVNTSLKYIIPLDPDKWPYFLYIGGQVYGELAQVDPKRRDEFEALCLKICPSQQWLGIIVEYV